MTSPASIYIFNESNSADTPIIARLGNTFLDRLKGLMFHSTILENEGLLLVLNQSSRLQSSIHMAFINNNLGIIWINDQFRVTQVEFAHRWISILFPSKPAKYILETHPENIPLFATGDKIRFEQIP